MHPFRDDRRSKSIEEREEEYQRVRDRIFAHDVSSCFNCLFSAVLLSAVRQPHSPDRELAGTKEAGARECIELQGTPGVSGRGPGSGKRWKRSQGLPCVPRMCPVWELQYNFGPSNRP